MTQVIQNTEAATYRKVTLRIMPLFFLCYMFSFLDRINVGYAKLQMLKDLNFSETVYGLGAGIFFVGYVLFQIPSNVILHYVGARFWISFGTIIWGIISTLTMFVSTPFSFYLVRFLLGVFEAGLFPGIILYLSYWYPNQKKAQIISILFSALAVSGVIGGPISGWILESTHQIGGLRGWQWLFLIEGLPTVLLGILCPFILSNNIQSAKWLNNSEKNLLSEKILHSQAENEKNYTQVSLLNAFKDKRIHLITFIYFILGFCGYGLGFFLPTVIKQTGVSGYLNIGLISAIPYGAAIALMIPWALNSDKTKERRWHLIFPILIAAIGFLGVIYYTKNELATFFFLSLTSAGLLTATTIFWVIPTTFFQDIHAATGVGYVNCFSNLGGFLAPYMIGYYLDLTHSTNIPFLICVILLFLAAIMAYMFPQQKPIK